MKRKAERNIWKIMAKNIPKFDENFKPLDLWTNKAQAHTHTQIPGHTMIKLLKSRGKNTHTLHSWEQKWWQQQIYCWKQCKQESSGAESLKYWKKKCQPRTLYPIKISFENKGEIITFWEIQNRKYIS